MRDVVRRIDVEDEEDNGRCREKEDVKDERRD